MRQPTCARKGRSVQKILDAILADELGTVADLPLPEASGGVTMHVDEVPISDLGFPRRLTDRVA